ncbi:MAG: dephospho-CoA kinase [Lachnospiraceae bacterium]|nr:dephospho-CoA kinase [Lachnospiraceae bacterium]
MKPSKNKPFVIGVTGGVGSGKSAVLAYAKKNYPVRILLADEVGRELMEPGKCVYDALVLHYGSWILLPDGSLNRKKLSDLCFGDPKEQELLNSIEHPLIRKEIVRRIRRTRKPVLLLEAALLVEGGLTELCDELIYVHVSEETRIRRLSAGRGYSEEKSRQIMSLQLSQEAFLSASTAVLDNSGPFEETAGRFDEIMKQWGIDKKA